MSFNKHGFLAWGILFFAVVYVTGCRAGGTTSGDQGPVAEKDSKPAAAARPAWETKWETARSQGRKERVVVIYTVLEAGIREEVRRAFREAHNIDLEYIVGRGAELLAKARAERNARVITGDVLLSGGASTVEFNDNGILGSAGDMLILPEVIDPAAWLDARLPFIDKQRHTMSYVAEASNTWVINTDLVRPDEAGSFKDLLNARWKGKMTLVDPSTTGSGSKFINVAAWGVMGEPYIRELARQEIVITRDNRLHMETVARGKYPIGLGAVSEMRVSFQRAGAPVKQIIPAEGGAKSAGSGALGVFDGGPHPNATTVFVNWLLSKDGQTVMGKARGSASRRLDVPKDFVDPDRLIKPGVNYVEGDTEEMVRTEVKRQALSREIFGIK